MAVFETEEMTVEGEGLLASPIRDYLERVEKTVDDAILTDTVHRLRQLIVKDLMQPRRSRAGKESNTIYGACPRKSRLILDGAPAEKLRHRTIYKFLIGDITEETLLCVSRLAGVPIVDNNIDLTVTGNDGKEVPVHPDGRFLHDGEWFNVEIKSTDSRTFDRWDKEGIDDTWNYLTQASMEIEAWRQSGCKAMNKTIFLVGSTGARQGSIKEWVIDYNPELVKGWHARRNLARGPEVPPIPFEAVAHTKYHAGLQLPAEAFEHGVPVPRINAKEKVYGYDVPTGKRILPLVCSYCDFKETVCWKNATKEFVDGKPIFVVD